jgi:hypothetical protein
LFSGDENIKLPQGLLTAVLARVHFEQKRAAKKELVLVGSLTLGSLAAIIPAFSYFISSFIQSSFYQYLSVIFSDGTSVLIYWKEILMSLAESVPFWPIIIFSAVLVVFLWSASRATRDAKVLFLPAYN